MRLLGLLENSARSNSRPTSVVGVAWLSVLAALPSFAAPPTFSSATLLQEPTPGSGMYFGSDDSVSAGYGAVGYSVIGGHYRAARWAADGSGIGLAAPPGHPLITSYGHGINKSGQTCGAGSFSGIADGHGVAVRWEPDGSAVVLGDTGLSVGGLSGSWAESINDGGQIGGFARDAYGDNHAVRWAPDGSATLLQGLNAVAAHINNAGQAVGESNGRAARWGVDGSFTLLDPVPGQASQSYAFDINEVGQAVGEVGSGLNYDLHAVKWSANGSATLLPSLPGHTTRDSQAKGITDSGIVAGSAFLSDIGDYRGLIWDAAGNPVLLQDLMADGNTWKFTVASGIEANATNLRVLAQGSKNGGSSAWYILDAQVPEPTSVPLLATICVRILRPRRRRKSSSSSSGGGSGR